MENKKITVTFDSQGGMPFDNEEYVSGEEYALPLPEYGLGADLRGYYMGKLFEGDQYPLQQPRYAPYAFGGWFTKVGGAGRRVKPRGVWKFSSDLTLYAYWLGSRGLRYRRHVVRALRLGGLSGDVAIQPWVRGVDTKKIGEYAFHGCGGLKSMIIPDGVTCIEKCAFKDCVSLTDVTVPDSVKNIGTKAFKSCRSLAGITIPDEVIYIEPDTFAGCTSLSSITIPDSVISIGDLAFSGCTGLTSLTIPDSVMSIGDQAFGGCSSLTEKMFNGTRAQWEAITKNYTWNRGTPAAVVHCLDGDSAI